MTRARVALALAVFAAVACDGRSPAPEPRVPDEPAEVVAAYLEALHRIEQDALAGEREAAEWTTPGWRAICVARDDLRRLTRFGEPRIDSSPSEDERIVEVTRTHEAALGEPDADRETRLVFRLRRTQDGWRIAEITLEVDADTRRRLFPER